MSMFEDITAIEGLLQQILEENNVSPCHGIEHARKVMNHAENALVDYPDLNLNLKYAVLLAALLHDADDGKFFPTHKNYENLISILTICKKSDLIIDTVVQMVSLVSSSKNGDTIPNDLVGKEWMLIPRYADRLEAIGFIGIERCYLYNINVTPDSPLYLPTTPRPMTSVEIWFNATEERYKKYKGKSDSMIDHYYDKLLRLGLFPISNTYFDAECRVRHLPLINFLLKFGSGEIETKDDVKRYIEEHRV